MQTLKEKSLMGLSWNSMQQVATQIILFVHYLLMSRLLSPKEYGIVAMLWVFTGCAELVKDLGINALIFQEKDITQKSLSTIFWTNVGIGFLFSSLFWLSSPLIAHFYHQTTLETITKYYAIYFFISAFAAVPIILLEKKFQFQKLFYIQFSAVFISLITSVFMAYFGFGVWSLIAQPILQAIFTNVFVWIKAAWFPDFVWEKSAFLFLQKKALPLLGANTLSYTTRNIDNLLIGKYFDEYALGNYTRAYSLMQMPFQLINGIMMRVMMPTFSQIQGDTNKVLDIYLRMIAMLALFVFPMSAGMMLVSDMLIFLLFGEKWAGVAPIFQILAIAGAVQAVNSPVGIIYLTCNKNNLLLKMNFLSSTISIVCFVIGALISVKMVAYMIAFASTFSLLIHVYTIGKLLGFSLHKWLKNLIYIVLCTTIMAFFVFLIGKINANCYMIFALQILTGILVYPFLLHIAKIPAYQELRKIIDI